MEQLHYATTKLPTRKMKRSAFTLIEILIAISITGILLGLGFAGFRQYSQRQVLFAAARDVKSDLRSLQQKALSGEKPAACAGKILEGYRFDIVSGGTQYKMLARCQLDVEINLQNLDGFTISPTGTQILFKVLGQGTNILSGTSSTIRLTQTGTTKYIELTVSAEGSIK